MDYNLIIFDFDGTLADSFPWFITAINKVAVSYKIKQVSREDFESFRDLDARMILKRLGVPFWKIPQISMDMRSLMHEEIRTIRLFEGVERLLPLLKSRGATLGLVSSNSYENIRIVLGDEITDLFGYYQCGASIWGKVRRLRRILRESGIAPQSAIYIGDEIRDLQAARSVGIKFGAVAWGYNRLEAIEPLVPDEIYFQVSDIAQRCG